METPKKCKDCDWSDYEAGGSVVLCTLATPWQEVDPEQEACGDFVETEE
jgi:hypothetical protein